MNFSYCKENEQTESSVGEETVRTNDANKRIDFKQFYNSIDKSKKDALVKNFFDINKYEGKSEAICRVEKCKHMFSYIKSWNLLRHTVLVHSDDVYKFLNNMDISEKKKINVQNFFKAEENKMKEVIALSSRQDFEKIILSMLKAGVSFSFFENAGCKQIFEAYSRVFDVSINRKSVIKILEKHYRSSVNQITNDVKGRLINIKLDGVSIHNRYFLGINIQFYNGSIMVVKNIGLEEINGTTTSLVLKSCLQRVLDNYDIHLNQVFSIVTDNGANYLKIGRLLNEEIIKTREADVSMKCENEENDLDELIENTVFYNSVDDNQGSSDNFFPSDLDNFGINIIRCGCHTLQLAIYDSLRHNVIFIGDIRTIVKIFRAPLYRNVFRIEKLKVPIVDTVTRWNSTYYMIKSFLDISTFILKEPLRDFQQEKKLQLINKAANFVKDYEELEKLTILYQKQDLLYSDFAYNWINTLNKYSEKQMDSEDLSIIYKSMLKRSENIIGEKVPFAAMYLDPRYRNYSMSNNLLLNETKIFIKKTHIFITKSSSCASTVSENINDAENFRDIFNVLVKQDFDNKIETDEKLQYYDLEKEIIEYERIVLDRNLEFSDPISFWIKMKDSFKLLSRVAICLLTVPSSQVSVERLFSMLKFIMNPLRSNIGDDNLKMLLHVTTNDGKF